jgi:tetratricopeptide (TPR) repeat protein
VLSASLAADREAYAETDYPQTAGWSRLRALAEGRWKVIVSSETELYDVAADPGETTNVAEAHASTARAMSARLLALEREQGARPAPSPSADAVERLRALGYTGVAAPPLAPGEGDNPARRIEAWVRFEDALGLVARGRAREAEPALAALAREFPDAPVFQSTWARALDEAGEPRRALAVYRRLVKRRSTDAVLLHELAVCARDAGQAGEARRAEEASLALGPDQAAPWNGLGLLSADAGDAAGAAHAFEEAVRRDPTNASYRVNLGNARRAAGDLDGAEGAYRDALDHDPDATDAMNGLGVLLVQRRHAAEAVDWFTRALALDASYVEARLNLGIAYQEDGQPARAAEQYRKVLQAPARYAKERQAAAALLESLR